MNGATLSTKKRKMASNSLRDGPIMATGKGKCHFDGAIAGCYCRAWIDSRGMTWTVHVWLKEKPTKTPGSESWFPARFELGEVLRAAVETARDYAAEAADRRKKK